MIPDDETAIHLKKSLLKILTEENASTSVGLSVSMEFFILTTSQYIKPLKCKKDEAIEIIKDIIKNAGKTVRDFIEGLEKSISIPKISISWTKPDDAEKINKIINKMSKIDLDKEYPILSILKASHLFLIDVMINAAVTIEKCDREKFITQTLCDLEKRFMEEIKNEQN